MIFPTWDTLPDISHMVIWGPGILTQPPFAQFCAKGQDGKSQEPPKASPPPDSEPQENKNGGEAIVPFTHGAHSLIHHLVPGIARVTHHAFNTSAGSITCQLDHLSLQMLHHTDVHLRPIGAFRRLPAGPSGCNGRPPWGIRVSGHGRRVGRCFPNH